MSNPKWCFLNMDRKCGDECMAHVVANDTGECQIVVATQLIGLSAAYLRGYLDPAPKTVHPKSAPPPEVKL